MDLCHRLEPAGKSLIALLDPERDLMPTGGYEVAHDLGRWWDAILRLEETVGLVIPPEAEAASLRNLQRLTDNPDRLLMNRMDVPWLKDTAKINPHNFRETLLAFGGLIRCRHSLWAQEAALQLAGVMDRCLRSDGSFDFTKLGSWGMVPHTQDLSHTEAKRKGWFDGTASSGRALEALVWLFETTGETPFLNLGRRIAEHHLEYSTNRDGTVRKEIVSPDNAGHDHSYLGTLRGLLLFGLLTGQKEYVDVVEATYRNTVRRQIVKESGWAPHDLGTLRFPNEYGDPVSDPASTGDAAQLALWLALRAGCHDLFDDVERYVRARLLPAQGSGAWCIHGPTHGGKGCTPDVLAAVTHSLCDIQANICTRTDVGLRVNLHFDYEDARIKIVSTRGRLARLLVLAKQPDNVMIRVPRWVPESSLRLTVDGAPQPVKWLGSFVWVPKDALNRCGEIIMSHDLPGRFTEEQMPSGRSYRFEWRGDEIVGVDPQDLPLPFYSALEGDPGGEHQKDTALSKSQAKQERGANAVG